MATMQAKFTDQDRATIEKVTKAMNEAAASVKERPPITKCSVYTRAFMWNGHRVDNTTLGLYDSKTWSRQPYDAPYPEVLKCGSKAGLVYTDAAQPHARKWVVAFDAMKNKAFVDAGPIGPTDWNVVRVKLDTEGADYYEFVDPIFGGRAYATIRPDEDEGYKSKLLVLLFN
ncbi:hypothetical protein RND81_14G042000 [Saponaria officinalis]|uniref:Uncharacterized protein n=1 Tax=Saponaria officinalis TaxID=3572 RepID=A0AAW1GKY7_SAPOF